MAVVIDGGFPSLAYGIGRELFTLDSEAVRRFVFLFAGFADVDGAGWVRVHVCD